MSVFSTTHSMRAIVEVCLNLAGTGKDTMHTPSEDPHQRKVETDLRGPSLERDRDPDSTARIAPGADISERDAFAELVGPSLRTKYITNEKLSTDFEKRVAIIGGGSYGAAIAKVLADNRIDTAIWTRREDAAQSINENHESDKLPGRKLPKELWASSDMERVMRDRGIIILASPSYSLEEIANTIKPHPDSIVISLAKGFVFEGGNPFKTAADYQRGPEPGTKVTLPAILLENIPHWEGFGRIATVAGPGFAKNIVDGTPFGLVVAARDIELAYKVRKYFQGEQARVFVCDDPCTVQIAGAMKNVIAIGAGMNHGLAAGGKYREEGIAMLISRGLKEMTCIAQKFAEAHNSRAQYRTVIGVAGVGDLVLTTTSRESRNYRMGEELGKGTPVVEAINHLNVTAEGLGNAWGAKMLADQLATTADGMRLFMPISNAVVDVLQGHVAPERVFTVLFRDLEMLEQADYIGDPNREVGDIYF